MDERPCAECGNPIRDKNNHGKLCSKCLRIHVRTSTPPPRTSRRSPDKRKDKRFADDNLDVPED